MLHPKPPEPHDGPPVEDNEGTSPPHEANAENIFSGRGVPQEGQFKFLGYMGSERHANYPDVPTFTESGYDIVWEHPYGVAGPKGLPEEVKAVLSEANEKVWDIPEFKEEMGKLGLLIYKKDGKEYKEHLEKMEDDMAKANSLIK